jgi:phthalate 4,5-dioxygenase
MLSIEDNERITRVGPGTPMGALMRQYWIPAMLTAEVPAPDSDPVRVLVLGERLVAFRDTDGQVGLLRNACPHRGASLFLGRNEECGIRCVYHGWKFATDGACLDIPNEPAARNFKERIRAVSYPVIERGGVVWAYLGPRATPPPLPDFEGNAEGGSARAVMRDCNWLQALEGDIDTSHFSFLHLGSAQPEDYPEGSFTRSTLVDRAPRYQVLDSPAGAVYAAYRPFEPGKLYWRVANFAFPFYTQPGPGTLGAKVNVRAWMPMDDGHTLFFMMTPPGGGNQADFARRAAAAAAAAGQGGSGGATGATPGPPMAVLPNGTGWYERFRLAENDGNDYFIDRELQRSGGEFTGIKGIHTQDQAITESMGAVVAREDEHLGTSDVMIIRVRNRLLNAANALEKEGAVPPGVDEPQVYRARSGGIILDEGVEWFEATTELRDGYATVPEVDRSHEP